MHATELIAVINAQKAGDQTAVYQSLREAYSHMAHTAKALAGGTAAKFPEKFDGAVDSKASDLRSGLGLLLREHVWLAGSATGAALGGRMPQFDAVGRRPQRPDQQQHRRPRRPPSAPSTAPRWARRSTVCGAATSTSRSSSPTPRPRPRSDQAGQDAAVTQLKAYAKEFGTTINSVNDKLPAEVVEGGHRPCTPPRSSPSSTPRRRATR